MEEKFGFYPVRIEEPLKELMKRVSNMFSRKLSEREANKRPFIC